MSFIRVKGYVFIVQAHDGSSVAAHGDDAEVTAGADQGRNGHHGSHTRWTKLPASNNKAPKENSD